MRSDLLPLLRKYQMSCCTRLMSNNCFIVWARPIPHTLVSPYSGESCCVVGKREVIKYRHYFSGLSSDQFIFVFFALVKQLLPFEVSGISVKGQVVSTLSKRPENRAGRAKQTLCGSACCFTVENLKWCRFPVPSWIWLLLVFCEGAERRWMHFSAV